MALPFRPLIAKSFSKAKIIRKTLGCCAKRAKCASFTTLCLNTTCPFVRKQFKTAIFFSRVNLHMSYKKMYKFNKSVRYVSETQNSYKHDVLSHWVWEIYVKVLDMIGNRQKPVFPLCVSQHMHNITNL